MSELQPVQPLNPSPFKCLVATVGNIPTSFAQSLSYFEALQKLAKYIKDILIPALNDDTAAIAELQAKYVELKNYVDTYFDDLNVQEQINNKLDAMAESGELADIINQEIFGEIQSNLASINEFVEKLDGTGITVEHKTYRDTNYNDTDYYITTIPRVRPDGNINELKHYICGLNGQTITPTTARPSSIAQTNHYAFLILEKVCYILQKLNT